MNIRINFAGKYYKNIGIIKYSLEQKRKSYKKKIN